MTGMTIRSADFADGERIPAQFSAEGGNATPGLTIAGADPSAVELALVCHDADAPDPGGFTHWTVYGIPPSTEELQDAGFRQGPNDAGTMSWWGPKPPVGHGTHHYTFTVYALSRRVDGTPSRNEFLAEYSDAIIGEASLVGTYVR